MSPDCVCNPPCPSSAFKVRGRAKGSGDCALDIDSEWLQDGKIACCHKIHIQLRNYIPNPLLIHSLTSKYPLNLSVSISPHSLTIQ